MLWGDSPALSLKKVKGATGSRTQAQNTKAGLVMAMGVGCKGHNPTSYLKRKEIHNYLETIYIQED